MIMARLNGIILTNQSVFLGQNTISAVFCVLEAVNIYCFKDRVKLNNPLMGTETLFYIFIYSIHKFKLN